MVCIVIKTIKYFKLKNNQKNFGPDRGLNPEPLAPKARIIPLDHQATLLYFLLITRYFLGNYWVSKIVAFRIFLKSE